MMLSKEIERDEYSANNEESEIYYLKLENAKLKNMNDLLKRENIKLSEAKVLLKEYNLALKQKEEVVENFKKDNMIIYNEIKVIPQVIRKFLFKDSHIDN